MFIYATTRQQISMCSKLIFACLYLHIWKSGGTKIFSLTPLANHVLYPSLLESRRRPCPWRQSKRKKWNYGG